MDKRLSQINNLIDKLESNEDDEHYFQIEDEIKLKFPNLQYYSFVDPNILSLGNIIRYVNLQMNKISLPVIIIRIDRVTYLDSYEVSTIYVKFYRRMWKINPKKHYIFLSNNVGSVYDDNFMMNEIEKYKNNLYS